VNSPFRNCLEKSCRLLDRALLAARSDRSWLLLTLLTALVAPIQDLLRFSKQFLHALGCTRDQWAPLATFPHEAW
jgi:hypothetical protein